MSDSFPLERATTLPGPAWLSAQRAAAADQFRAAALPDPTREEWRYSRIESLDFATLAQVDDAPREVDHGPAPARTHEISSSLGEFAGRMIHHNGRLVAAELDPALAERGVRVGLLADLAEAVEVAEPSAAIDDAFTDYVLACGLDPLVIDVPRNVVIDRPFQVIGLVDSPEPLLVLPRLVIRAGENSEFSVVDWLTSDTDAASVVVPRVQLSVAPAARVNMVGVNDLGDNLSQLGGVIASVGQEATARLSHVALGGSYARNRFDCRLVGRGASGFLSALYVGGGDQMHDLRTFQTHEAPDTTSELLFKGALDDRSHAVYTGMIRVDHEARGTNATQTNRIIKLSDDAWAESVPNLEINHNDVRCAHASVVGPIDEDQRFYLESRGVPPEVAERLVVNGFFEEVLDHVGVPGVADVVRPLIIAKLGVAK